MNDWVKISHAWYFADAYEEDSDVQKGASVGVVIADDSVFNLDGEAHAALAETLSNLTELQKTEKKKKSGQEGDTASVSSEEEELKLGKIGSTMVKTAQLVTKGMEVGAEKATALIEYAGEKQVWSLTQFFYVCLFVNK